MLWKVIVSSVNIKMCTILNGCRNGAVGISRRDSVTFLFVGSGRRARFTKERWDKREELLDRISDAAGCIRKREDRLRRTARDFHTRVAKCTEAKFKFTGSNFSLYI